MYIARSNGALLGSDETTQTRSHLQPDCYCLESLASARLATHLLDSLVECRDNGIGEEGGVAVAEALRRLTGLEYLVLTCDAAPHRQRARTQPGCPRDADVRVAPRFPAMLQVTVWRGGRWGEKKRAGWGGRRGSRGWR